MAKTKHTKHLQECQMCHTFCPSMNDKILDVLGSLLPFMEVQLSPLHVSCRQFLEIVLKLHGPFWFRIWSSEISCVVCLRDTLSLLWGHLSRALDSRLLSSEQSGMMLHQITLVWATLWDKNMSTMQNKWISLYLKHTPRKVSSFHRWRTCLTQVCLSVLVLEFLLHCTFYWFPWSKTQHNMFKIQVQVHYTRESIKNAMAKRKKALTMYIEKRILKFTKLHISINTLFMNILSLELSTPISPT